VTDLFLSNVGRLGDSQIAAVDASSPPGRAVEAATVIQLSEALSTIERARARRSASLRSTNSPRWPRRF